MKTKIKEILFTFVCVTTLVVLASAIYITVFWEDANIGVDILWQILLSSALCSLGNLLYGTKELSKKQMVIRVIIHYIYIIFTVFTCGILFEWFYLNQLPMVIGMFVLITIVFSIVWTILKVRDLKVAIQLNERLEEYRQKSQE